MAPRRISGALPAALLLSVTLLSVAPVLSGTVAVTVSAPVGPPVAPPARPGALAPVTATAAAAGVAPRGWPPIIPAPTGTASASGGRCGDAAGTWLGMRWRGELRWRINSRTVPAYLGTPAEVRSATRSAAATIDHGRNDCGLPERLDIRQRYLGETTRVAGVLADGGCGHRDGHNVVSFGELTAGLLAVTCIWWYGGRDGGRSVEADILVDDASGLFFLSTPVNCAGRWDLESTLTHEFGHAFGLGHVAYAEHALLTMSDGLPDCSTAHRSLGLGDYQTLARQYGLSRK